MKKTGSYQKLIEGGKRLFWKYGINRVTVEEICKESSVSKMSFYRVFQNKMDLAKAVFDVEIEKGMTRFRELYNSDLSFIEKLEQTIHMKMENAESISKEFYRDIFSHQSKEFQEYLATKSSESTRQVMEFYRTAQAVGDIRKDLNLALIPILSEQIRQLASDERVLSMYDSPRELVKEVSTFFFYGIVPHPKHP